MVKSTTEESIGHLYVIDGDLQEVAVNAWLLPLDEFFSPTRVWAPTLNRLNFDPRKQAPWEAGELVRYLATVDGSDVWIGKVGQGDSETSERRTDFDEKHYSQCAIQFIQKAGKRVNADRDPHKGRPLLAINHLGTGRGGAKGAHGELIRHLIQEVTSYISNPGQPDVVLVSWGSKPEAAAQQIRYQRFENWRSDPQWSFPYKESAIHDHAELIAQRLKSRSCSIFLGAGVSSGAGLLGWNELLLKVGEETIPSTTEAELSVLPDPRDKAALLQKRLEGTEKTLGNELRNLLKASKYSLQHGLISSLPCDEFITTNVDELFEMSSSTAGRSITVIPEAPVGKDRWLLKLHGTISQPKSLVFTRDNYLNAVRSSRALLGLVQAMLFTRHMFFIGYGLRDEDFHELVYEVRSAFPEGKLKKQIGTALALFEDPIQSELWSEVLSVVALRPPRGDSMVSEKEFELAIRDAQRFLDLVGMLSSDRSAFLLDVHYEGMRTDSENEAFMALSETITSALKHSDEEPGWAEIRKLLRKLGAPIPGSKKKRQ